MDVKLGLSLKRTGNRLRVAENRMLRKILIPE
jgi:hypothetical protein